MPLIRDAGCSSQVLHRLSEQDTGRFVAKRPTWSFNEHRMVGRGVRAGLKASAVTERPWLFPNGRAAPLVAGGSANRPARGAR